LARATETKEHAMHPMSLDITALLAGVGTGNRDAEEHLIAGVYRALHRMAARHMRRERPDHTLQPTALVHEAYVRLLGQHGGRWENRAHFFGVAAQVMRRILVDHARKRKTARRGGGQWRVSLDGDPALCTLQADALIALDEALTRLGELDPRQRRIVELRFFAGLTEEEIGRILGVTSRTVKRDWRVAKAWLYNELTS
jgi:RNA polymerase sigma-70 factor, ECF subfamily